MLPHFFTSPHTLTRPRRQPVLHKLSRLSRARKAGQQYVAGQVHIGGAWSAAGSCLEGGGHDLWDGVQVAGLASIPEAGVEEDLCGRGGTGQISVLSLVEG